MLALLAFETVAQKLALGAFELVVQMLAPPSLVQEAVAGKEKGPEPQEGAVGVVPNLETLTELEQQCCFASTA
jgi:hypothetical protein